MKKTKKIAPGQIVVTHCHSWRSSTSRAMAKAGKDASAAAIAEATAAGIATSYWKDGAVCWSNGNQPNAEK